MLLYFVGIRCQQFFQPAVDKGKIMSRITLTICNHPENPSVEDVLEAFLHAYSEKPKFILMYLEESKGVLLRITGLDYESGAKGQFNIRGGAQAPDGEHRFDGFYDAINMKGHINVS